MRNKKALVGIVALVLAALLVVTPVGAFQHRFYSYPADIHIEGTITLENLETDSVTDIKVFEDFAALVPIFVNPGTYDAGFIGKAVASDGSIKFLGLIIVPTLVVPMVRRGNFWVNFRVDKPDDLPNGIYIADGELEITISPIQPGEAKVIWVHMKGLVTSFGGEEAFGGVMAHARVAEEEDDWAMVHGFLTQQTPPTEVSEEYTFSFLAFRFANTTQVTLNDDFGNDLNISGSWNVYEVTWTYFDNSWTRTIEQILEEAPGDLTVNLETTGTFSLAIDDLDPIKGNVIFYHIRYGVFIEPPMLSIRRVSADFNGDWKVNMIDIAKTARSYGATIGTPRYDFLSDINFDYHINIIDVSTVAQAFGQEY